MKMLAIPAAAAAFVVASGALAQSATYDPYPSDPAQLQREHNRAMAAGDSANDPFNPASSNALNQAQVQGTVIPNGPGYADTASGNAYVAPDSTVYDGQDTTGQMSSDGTLGDQYAAPNTCITPPQAIPPGSPQPPACTQQPAPSGSTSLPDNQVW